VLDKYIALRRDWSKEERDRATHAHVDAPKKEEARDKTVRKEQQNAIDQRRVRRWVACCCCCMTLPN
jgi:hypothetical protein